MICKKINNTLLVSLILLASGLKAQTVGFQSINIPSSTMSIAMGGYNISSVYNESGNFTSNPALYSDSLLFQSTTFLTPIFFGITKTGIISSVPIPRIGNVFFEVARTGYGQIQGYDPSANPTEILNPADVVFSAGKSFTSGNFSLGIKLNYARSSIQNFRSNAFTVDLGGNFRHPTRELSAALLIKNIGSSFGGNTTFKTRILPDIQVGATYKPEYMPFRFCVTAYNLVPFPSSRVDAFDEDRAPINKVLRYVNAGGELLLTEKVHLITGFNFKRAEEFRLEQSSGGAGFSFGIRIITSKLIFEYGRARYHVSGALNQVSLSFNIKNVLNK